MITPDNKKNLLELQNALNLMGSSRQKAMALHAAEKEKEEILNAPEVQAGVKIGLNEQALAKREADAKEAELKKANGRLAEATPVGEEGAALVSRNWSRHSANWHPDGAGVEETYSLQLGADGVFRAGKKSVSRSVSLERSEGSASSVGLWGVSGVTATFEWVLVDGKPATGLGTYKVNVSTSPASLTFHDGELKVGGVSMTGMAAEAILDKYAVCAKYGGMKGSTPYTTPR